MRQLALLSVITFFSLVSTLEANIDNKIETTKADIKKQKQKEANIERKLEEIGGEITKEEAKLKSINQDILVTKQRIQEQNKKTQIKQGELKKIEGLYDDLVKREKEVNRKLTDIISQSISIEMTMSGENNNEEVELSENSIDNIIMQTVYDSYGNILKEKFSSTKKRYIKLQKNITIVKTELDKLKGKLKDLRSQISKYDSLKTLKKKTLTSLDSEKSAYLAKLNRIQKERKSLDATLNKLNITKVERDKTIIKPADTTANVRQIGSSYIKSDLVKYRGPKTISPLEHYVVAQDFGTYVDPIYNMQIFNESVILRSKTQNARVQNVLDGKVIYADKTSMLENVVIVKHKDNIHTIYAHLSQLAPIKVGQKIPKGYVIGRINRELTFEVTQNEKHMNPMRLIE